MQEEFLLDYILWVFFSTSGVFQFVMARNGLRGAMFVRHRPAMTAAGSLALAATAFVLYFASENRNWSDTTLGLDANRQALWFTISAGAAIVLTLIITSILNHRWGAGHGWDPRSGEPPPAGIEWLRHTTFARAIAARAIYLWARKRRRSVHG